MQWLRGEWSNLFCDRLRPGLSVGEKRDEERETDDDKESGGRDLLLRGKPESTVLHDFVDLPVRVLADVSKRGACAGSRRRI